MEHYRIPDRKFLQTYLTNVFLVFVLPSRSVLLLRRGIFFFVPIRNNVPSVRVPSFLFTFLCFEVDDTILMLIVPVIITSSISFVVVYYFGII